jgi:transcriptional regulator with XRE-family HTH domain
MDRMNTASAKPRGQRKPAGATTVTDALRQAMLDSGLSAYRLAALSGVNVAAVLRFRSGERSLKLESVDRLAGVLGLELRALRKGR